MVLDVPRKVSGPSFLQWGSKTTSRVERVNVKTETSVGTVEILFLIMD